MSGTALGWVKRIAAPCAQTRNLLRVLADYANDDLFAYPALRTMAGEMQLDERQVKRLLRKLEAAGLLIGFEVTDKATRRTRTSVYWFPVFADAPNERLVQSCERTLGGTMKRRQVEIEPDREGGSHVPLEGGDHVPGEGGSHVPPRGVSTSPLEPPLEPAGPNGPTPGERAPEGFEDRASPFDRVFAAWAGVAPGRLSRPKAVGPWAEACAKLDELELQRRALRYLAEDPDVQRGRALSLDRWLAEERWEAWAAATTAASALMAAARTGFAGPPDLRSALVAAFGSDGEGKAGSYLDPSNWNEAGRCIEAKTGSAEAFLRSPRAAAVLGRFGVKVGRVRA